MFVGVGHFKDDYHFRIEAFLPIEVKVGEGVEGNAIVARRQAIV